MNRTHKVLFLLFILSLIFFLLRIVFQKRSNKGAQLYTLHCGSCHMEDGSGVKGLIPPLADADFIKENPEKLACIIRYGLHDEIEVNGKQYWQQMPANTALNEVDIYNLVHYINTQWGKQIPQRSIEQIRNDLDQCKDF